jgi:hypothetical protein
VKTPSSDIIYKTEVPETQQFLEFLSLVSESEVPNTEMIAKAQFKKRKNREESEIGEQERLKRKATRDIESSDISQRIETAIDICSDSICKIRREFKEEIFSLKCRIEKAEEAIEKMRINENIVFESHRIFLAGVNMMQRTFKA